MFQKTHHSLALSAITLSAYGVLPAAGQVLDEDIKLIASDWIGSVSFGRSIAIDNGVIAVGAPGSTIDGVNNAGAAYLYDAITGVELVKLVADDEVVDNDNLGFSIAIDNGLVAVGAHADNENGQETGAVYLFDGSTGIQLFKLKADDGENIDQFGYSVAIDNGIVAIGVRFDDDNGDQSGSAYLFDATTGQQIRKLHPVDGDSYDHFGHCIAIDNGIVAVGAYGDNDNGTSSGSAYLFDATTGLQLFKLLPDDGDDGDRFGFSISIDNDIVAVGASRDDDNGSWSGSAYLFDATTGESLDKLLPDDGDGGDNFGITISIENGLVAVGSPHTDDNGSNSGSAYVFDASTGLQIFKLIPSDGEGNDRFCDSIAIDNGVVAAGVIRDRHSGANHIIGSAYVFKTCPADLNGDGELDFVDISFFLANDPDLNGDGFFDFVDISAFLASFEAGCP